MYPLALVLLLAVLLHGCAVSLSQHGAAVTVVEDRETNDCKFLAIVTGSNALGYNTAHDAEGALNQVRNKAGQTGGNAIKMIDIDATPFSTTAVAEALVVRVLGMRQPDRGCNNSSLSEVERREVKSRHVKGAHRSTQGTSPILVEMHCKASSASGCPARS